MPYRAWLQRLAPPWLQGETAKKALGEIGGACDDLAQQVRDGVLERFPENASSEALDAIGADRLLPRGPGESDSAYAQRLLAAWDAFPLAGSHTGLLRQLKVAGYPTAEIVQQNGRHAVLDGTLAEWITVTDAAPWLFDPAAPADQYTRFGILFQTNIAALVEHSAENAALCRIVRRWRPAKALYMGCWLITGAAYWGNTARTWGGVVGPNWASGASRWVPAIPDVDLK